MKTSKNTKEKIKIISDSSKEMMKFARNYCTGFYRFYNLSPTKPLNLCDPLNDFKITGRGCVMNNGYTKFNSAKDDVVVQITADSFFSYDSLSEIISEKINEKIENLKDEENIFKLENRINDGNLANIFRMQSTTKLEIIIFLKKMGWQFKNVINFLIQEEFCENLENLETDIDKYEILSIDDLESLRNDLTDSVRDLISGHDNLELREHRRITLRRNVVMFLLLHSKTDELINFWGKDFLNSVFS